MLILMLSAWFAIAVKGAVPYSEPCPEIKLTDKREKFEDCVVKENTRQFLKDSDKCAGALDQYIKEIQNRNSCLQNLRPK
jgi:hypothetical protein